MKKIVMKPTVSMLSPDKDMFLRKAIFRNHHRVVVKPCL